MKFSLNNIYNFVKKKTFNLIFGKVFERRWTSFENDHVAILLGHRRKGFTRLGWHFQNSMMQQKGLIRTKFKNPIWNWCEPPVFIWNHDRFIWNFDYYWWKTTKIFKEMSDKKSFWTLNSEVNILIKTGETWNVARADHRALSFWNR